MDGTEWEQTHLDARASGEIKSAEIKVSLKHTCRFVPLKVYVTVKSFMSFKIHKNKGPEVQTNL